jgi:hypothetical protein
MVTQIFWYGLNVELCLNFQHISKYNLKDNLETEDVTYTCATTTMGSRGGFVDMKVQPEKRREFDFQARRLPGLWTFPGPGKVFHKLREPPTNLI